MALLDHHVSQCPPQLMLLLLQVFSLLLPSYYISYLFLVPEAPGLGFLGLPIVAQEEYTVEEPQGQELGPPSLRQGNKVIAQSVEPCGGRDR